MMDLFKEVEKLPSLSKHISDCGWINHDEYKFSRQYKFSVRNVNYMIECWANMGYLYAGELVILFHSFTFADTFPNSFKNNLHFYCQDEICAVLPVEVYVPDMSKECGECEYWRGRDCILAAPDTGCPFIKED